MIPYILVVRTGPLGSVEGKVENSHDVVIVIENAGDFTAHLGFSEGAETILGEYFLDLIKENKDKFYYSTSESTIISERST